MTELRKGQVVACWQGDNYCKVICIFVRKKGKFYLCRLMPDENELEEFKHCVPLEDIEPDAFLAREKDAQA